MPSEEKERMPQGNIWSSSSMTARWQQGAKRRRQDLAEATQRMLEAAGLKRGDRVLDIAAGTGEQSVVAARTVGPEGSVLATDISAEMLTQAAEIAEQEGLANIATRVMDAERLELHDNTFDAVICRLGLMLVPRVQQSLKEIQRVLKPGGKLAALVWSAPDRNPLFSLPLAVLSQFATETTLHLPDPFALSSPAVFERELTEAGFEEVATRPIPFLSRYASINAFLQSAAHMFASTMLNLQSQQDEQVLFEEVRQALSRFEGPDGLVTPAEVLLGAGRKKA